MRDRNAPLTEADIPGLAWEKMDALIPAIVQDHATGEVLMLGYMSPEALTITLKEGRATFHSRSRDRIWQKGETSGHHLNVKVVHADCDGDALLLLAEPAGPTCHLGSDSCFQTGGHPTVGWLGKLAQIVNERRFADPEGSYTARLMREGPVRIVQKVGEEAVELVLAAGIGERSQCVEEAADLMYHLTILMAARDFGWEDVIAKLQERHESQTSAKAMSSA